MQNEKFFNNEKFANYGIWENQHSVKCHKMIVVIILIISKAFFCVIFSPKKVILKSFALLLDCTVR